MNQSKATNTTATKDKKNILPLVASADLLVLISEKEKEISELESKIKNSLAELKQMKSKEKELQESHNDKHEIARIKVAEFSDKWSQFAKAGIKTREIILIQSVLNGETLETIRKELGVGAYRARTMLYNVCKRLRHPKYSKIFPNISEEIHAALHG
jgi:vacuolar-type H+-ATPase subunit I/STV1